MLEYAHIFLSLISSVVYLIIGLAVGQPSDKMLFNLIFVIIISYIAGLALRFYLKNTVFKIEDIDLSAEVSKVLAEEEAVAEGGENAQAPAEANGAAAGDFDFDGFDE